MHKVVFQNSRVALGFAALTVVSAVSMVGTSEDTGVVGRAADIVEEQRDSIAGDAQAFADSRGGGDTPPPAESGDDGTASVFGDYVPQGEPGAMAPAVSAPTGSNPMTAPLSPSAIASASGQGQPSGVPFISGREVTIEPQ